MTQRSSKAAAAECMRGDESACRLRPEVGQQQAQEGSERARYQTGVGKRAGESEDVNPVPGGGRRWARQDTIAEGCSSGLEPEVTARAR